jgi:hypothetical protein
MMGSGLVITPSATGKVLATFSGVNMHSNIAGISIIISLYYGTGTPPANGDSATGIKILNTGAPVETGKE